MKQDNSIARQLLRYCMVLSCSFPVASCIERDKSDLERFVAEIKAKKTHQVAPLPPFQPEEIYLYSRTDRDRDPFEKFSTEPTPVAPVEQAGPDRPPCFRPDMHRPKEQLESFPLDSLKMVGTLTPAGEDVFGLVTDPDGMIHRVRVGNYMGRNHGLVMSIADNEIRLQEQHEDGTGSGCYIQQESVLKIEFEG